MPILERLNQVREESKILEIDDSFRIILFSDCHRGDYGWADDFAKNQPVFLHALSYYFNENYTYIEMGDGDELWKNRNFDDIFRAHRRVFELMSRFYFEDRLFMLFGNHDIERSNPNYVRSTLDSFLDERTGLQRPLFPGIVVHPGLILRHTPSQRDLFLVHGHQGDLLADVIWPVGRFFVRAFWRNLQLYGLNDPTSAAKNFTIAKRVDKRLIHWSRENHHMIVGAHTHRPRFPSLQEAPYFNTGSVVSPFSISGIEIRYGQIAMVHWNIRADLGGSLRIVRDVVQGPQPLQAWKL